ncbi:hypothetical protein [Streptomyces sp. CC224B]|uniref:hypothetical protein n=1 Tax=Streptomyces sp. CC224B TaxID=3044571 RepID=UPI0024A821BA|nr:hypothetical protein [Streptomyces sp. CC224B]
MTAMIVRSVATQPGLSPADRAAHDASTLVRREVLASFPAGGPLGSWPAEDFAKARRADGVPAEVVYDYPSDAFLVIVRSVSS